jgi:hypothetical protein
VSAYDWTVVSGLLILGLAFLVYGLIHACARIAEAGAVARRGLELARLAEIRTRTPAALESDRRAWKGRT